MKLLHTSDWHVGKTIRGHSRVDEHRAVLKEVASIADQHSVDLVIVAGDLFESSTPTAESESVVYAALADLTREGRHVAVIAGNHDNARRLSALKPFLTLGKVHLVAEPLRPSDGGVLALTARDGTDLRVAMLPFVSKRGIIRAEDLMNSAAYENAQAYSERMRALLEALCAGLDDTTANILVNHSFVLGGQTGGGERLAHLVDEYAVSAQSFPTSLNYVALGHLHRPQRVPAGAPAYYSGSPLQLDFGEADQVKSVNVVAIEPGVPAVVQTVPLTAGLPLHTITGTIDELLDQARRDDAWLRVVVKGASKAGLAESVRDALGERVVEVRVESPGSARPSSRDERIGRSPQELFREYVTDEGVDDDRVLSLFSTLLEATSEEIGE